MRKKTNPEFGITLNAKELNIILYSLKIELNPKIQLKYKNKTKNRLFIWINCVGIQFSLSNKGLKFTINRLNWKFLLLTAGYLTIGYLRAY
jgi:hypothetical protein